MLVASESGERRLQHIAVKPSSIPMTSVCCLCVAMLQLATLPFSHAMPVMRTLTYKCNSPRHIEWQ